MNKIIKKNCEYCKIKFNVYNKKNQNYGEENNMMEVLHTISNKNEFAKGNHPLCVCNTINFEMKDRNNLAIAEYIGVRSSSGHKIGICQASSESYQKDYIFRSGLDIFQPSGSIKREANCNSKYTSDIEPVK